MVSYENRPKTFLGRLSQASRAMRTCFDAELKTLDLTLSRGRLMLHLVSASHVVTQSELTDVLEVEHPTIVRLLDGLEQSGHVQRQPLPGDRRAKAVVLTAEGQAVGERVLRMTDTLSEHLLEGIPPEDIDVAERVLMALSDNLGRALARETEAEPIS
ncbi:MarR family transcriptional regulator [Kaistia defluvii]|uniref:MarR family winged helix-turn-helix transcriptional regulator n=1 Tax=Kaistia defluvii TaxID=410841 RepID=UPI0022535D3A|nr:MarR family transcriptional regulator [Kaistia defluvii]MCX5516999.1 MarR family transcriptional regulator [Kaistia defluvii]